MGHQRASALRRTHGFTCVCERCTAPVGSHLYEEERLELALQCPAVTDRTDEDGSETTGPHLLLPTGPYLPAPAYTCSHAHCTVALTSEEATERVGGVRRAFETLQRHLNNGEHWAGCRAAEAAEELGRRVLGERHELWMLWASAVIGLASGFDSDPDGSAAHADADAREPQLHERKAEELLLRAYTIREAMLTHVCRAADEDVFVRVSHALVAGKKVLPTLAHRVSCLWNPPPPSLHRSAYIQHEQRVGLRTRYDVRSGGTTRCVRHRCAHQWGWC